MANYCSGPQGPNRAEPHEKTVGGHGVREYDLGPYDRMDEGELARFLHAGALLGLGRDWRSYQHDTSDERYRRCLAAASVALAGLWDGEAAGIPGEPLDAPEALIHDVYRAVDSFAFTKMDLYYAAIGEGIGTSMRRSQCRRSESAARRAVASLFGKQAMESAQRKLDRIDAEVGRCE